MSQVGEENIGKFSSSSSPGFCEYNSSLFMKGFVLMYRLIALAFLFLASHASHAQPVEIQLDGEPFVQKFSLKAPHGDKLIEFVRSSENLENWNKLIGFRYQQLPGAENDPLKVAVGMAAILKARGMMSSVSKNEKTSEAMIDFITRGKSDLLEFNVFRYTRSKGGDAVISLQLAYRFTDTTEQNVQHIIRLRNSWTKQAAEFDMKAIEDALEKIN